jgi:hypothetical protein
MIELAVVAGLLTGLCALLILDRRRHNPDIDALIALCDRLCQRLQAPATAILEHHQAVDRLPTAAEAPAAVQPDSDEDFWESRDALADRLMAEEREAANGR